MLVQQRTIKHPVSLSGIGLHTGATTSMTFRPAPEDYGIRFRRVDLGGAPEVPADVDHVVDLARGTTLAVGDARVHTVEHVMAALVGMQVDNIVIELDGIEPPIGDGSAKPYVDALLKAGFEKQSAPKDPPERRAAQRFQLRFRARERAGFYRNCFGKSIRLV